MREGKTYTEVCKAIDFRKLANSKKSLLITKGELKTKIENTEPGKQRMRLEDRLEGIEGMIELVDSIQDAATDHYGKKHSEIFPIMDIVRLTETAKQKN
jgi:predicted transposase YdaD